MQHLDPRLGQIPEEKLTPTLARTDSGLFYPTIEGTVHLDRFDRVTARMIKALFFKERGQRLPDEYEVISFSLAGLKGTALEDSNTLRKQIDLTLAGETKHIAGPQFIYWSRYYEGRTGLSGSWRFTNTITSRDGQ